MRAEPGHDQGKRRRVFLLEMDYAVPELAFDRWRLDLPNLSDLMDKGLWDTWRSCIPAITVPAWSSMLSSHDPGVYGFRHRADYSYDRMVIADGESMRQKRVWDTLGEAGLASVVVGVPQTYPVRPSRRASVSGRPIAWRDAGDELA